MNMTLSLDLAPEKIFSMNNEMVCKEFPNEESNLVATGWDKVNREPNFGEMAAAVGKETTGGFVFFNTNAPIGSSLPSSLADKNGAENQGSLVSFDTSSQKIWVFLPKTHTTNMDIYPIRKIFGV